MDQGKGKEGDLQIWSKEKLPSKIQWKESRAIIWEKRKKKKKEKIITDIEGVL